MKINLKRLLICVAIPLAVGGLSALISGGGMEAFEQMNKPPLSPPGWLFPLVWSILYVLMGIASYLILESDASHKDIINALTFYGVQLFFNFMWSILFFNFSFYTIAFIWLLVLWILILITTVLFYKISKPAAFLLIPYLLWVTFAGYLNFGIALLN